MSTSLFQEHVHEHVGNDWFSYTLSNQQLFSQTPYKAMCRPEMKSVLICRKLLCNGQIELLYETEGHISLASIFGSVQDEEFLRIVAEMLSGLISIQETGHLSCEYVQLDFEKIFVHPKTRQVLWVYLPLTYKLHESCGQFIKELQALLLQLINQKEQLKTERMAALYHHLQGPNPSLQELYTIARNSLPLTAPTQANDKCLCLVSINKAVAVRFKIHKERFLIGRNPEKVDACIWDSGAVGREHCEILQQNGQYYVKDLNSTNGTFLNEQRLFPQQIYPLKEGDKLRIADNEFQLCTE